MHSPVAEEARPTLHLLFMVGDRLNFPDIWHEFLAGASSKQQFRVWVHCTSGSDDCRSRVLEAKLPNVKIVDTAHSSRCVDLLSPEVRLLDRAIAWRPERAGAALDKFVLVSDTTLPIKPFATIYENLVSNSASDFCYFPEEEWPYVTDRQDSTKRHALPKTHQWAVFNRPHAKTLTENWEPVNKTWNWKLPQNGTMVPARNFKPWQPWHSARCTDEIAVFANIHGPVTLEDGKPFESERFNVHPACHTLVLFGWPSTTGAVGDGEAAVREGIYNDPETTLVDGPLDRLRGIVRRVRGHPMEFHKVGNTTQRALRDSTYFFARKFDRDAELTGFSEVMFKP